jgi:hypothetical protein
MAANKIELSGNTSRYNGQKTAILVHVSSVIAKKIHLDLYIHVGKDLNLMSVRRYLVCTFIGENGIPFVDIVSYGGSKEIRLRCSIGELFSIDCPAVEKQTELELTNQEVNE